MLVAKHQTIVSVSLANCLDSLIAHTAFVSAALEVILPFLMCRAAGGGVANSARNPVHGCYI
eukprot:COSAG02_NODE_1445_length_12580_cov_8.848089_7_plen_62_part_00